VVTRLPPRKKEKDQESKHGVLSKLSVVKELEQKLKQIARLGGLTCKNSSVHCLAFSLIKSLTRRHQKAGCRIVTAFIKAKLSIHHFL